MDCAYENFPIVSIEKIKIILQNHPELSGLNVTIPYKEQVLSFLDEMSSGDVSFMREMINLFIDRIPNDTEQLDKAFKNNDAETVKRLAHNMRSSLNMFLLDDLNACLAVIEEEATIGEFTSETVNSLNILHCGIIEVVKNLKEL